MVWRGRRCRCRSSHRITSRQLLRWAENSRLPAQDKMDIFFFFIQLKIKIFTHLILTVSPHKLQLNQQKKFGIYTTFLKCNNDWLLLNSYIFQNLLSLSADPAFPLPSHPPPPRASWTAAGPSNACTGSTQLDSGINSTLGSFIFLLVQLTETRRKLLQLWEIVTPVWGRRRRRRRNRRRGSPRRARRGGPIRMRRIRSARLLRSESSRTSSRLATVPGSGISTSSAANSAGVSSVSPTSALTARPRKLSPASPSPSASSGLPLTSRMSDERSAVLIQNFHAFTRELTIFPVLFQYFGLVFSFGTFSIHVNFCLFVWCVDRNICCCRYVLSNYKN